jgi:hypothetical protein
MNLDWARQEGRAHFARHLASSRIDVETLSAILWATPDQQRVSPRCQWPSWRACSYSTTPDAAEWGSIWSTRSWHGVTGGGCSESQ